MIAALPSWAKAPQPYLEPFIVPNYPPLARAARVQGDVKIRFAVNEKGETEELTVVSGHPMLKDAAVKNIKSWKFGWPEACKGCRVTREVTFHYKLFEDIAKPSRRLSVTWLENDDIVIQTDPVPIETLYSTEKSTRKNDDKKK
jgi:TonB family protein